MINDFTINTSCPPNILPDSDKIGVGVTNLSWRRNEFSIGHCHNCVLSHTLDIQCISKQPDPQFGTVGYSHFCRLHAAFGI